MLINDDMFWACKAKQNSLQLPAVATAHANAFGEEEKRSNSHTCLPHVLQNAAEHLNSSAHIITAELEKGGGDGLLHI